MLQMGRLSLCKSKRPPKVIQYRRLFQCRALHWLIYCARTAFAWMFLLLCLPWVGDKCLSSGCPLPAMQQPKFYNHLLARSHLNNSQLPFIMPDRTPEDILLSLRAWPTRARTGCRGHSRAVPSHWAWPQRARLSRLLCPAQTALPKAAPWETCGRSPG